MDPAGMNCARGGLQRGHLVVAVGNGRAPATASGTVDLEGVSFLLAKKA